MISSTEDTITTSRAMTQGDTTATRIYKLRVYWFHGGATDAEFCTQLREIMEEEREQHYPLRPAECD